MPLQFEILAGNYAVCQFAANAAIPAWARKSPVWCVVSAPDEFSVVCREDLVPPTAKAERGWICLRLVGPFPFELTGVLASVAGPLAEARIPIFAVSTYNTDYVLVPGLVIEHALEVLAAAGHVQVPGAGS